MAFDPNKNTMICSFLVSKPQLLFLLYMHLRTGRHYSVPDSMHSARQNLIKQRANTVSGIQPTTLDRLAIPTISINATETSQEPIATPTLAQNSNSESYAVTMSSSTPTNSFLSAQFQQWNDVTLPAQGLHRSPRTTRLVSEGSLRYSSSSLHHDVNRKISAPIPYTRDSLSGSSGFLGLQPNTHSPQVPHTNHWHISNPSSADVSQEHIPPDSIDSNVADPNQVPTLHQSGSFHGLANPHQPMYPRQCSQTSLYSLPTCMPGHSPPDGHFMPANPALCDPSVQVLPQTHVAVGQPMGRSMSLTHHHNLVHAHIGLHRRHHTIDSPRAARRKVLATPSNLPPTNWSHSPSTHYVHSFSPVSYGHCPQCGQTPVTPFIHNGDSFLPMGPTQSGSSTARDWEGGEHHMSGQNQPTTNLEESSQHDLKHPHSSQRYPPDCHNDVFDDEINIEHEPSPYAAYAKEESTNEHRLSEENLSAHNHGVKKKIHDHNDLMVNHQDTHNMRTPSIYKATDLRPSSASCGPESTASSNHILESHSLARSLPSLSVKKYLAQGEHFVMTTQISQEFRH